MTRHRLSDFAKAQPPAPARLVELPVERYLVSWDRAHAQELVFEMPGWFHHPDLLAHAPRGEHLVGVVVMRARAILRKTREEDVEISPDAVADMRRTMPATDLEHNHEYRVLLSTGDLRRCSFCGITPGEQPCSTCRGSGRVWHENDNNASSVACPTCAGIGTETCSACGGSVTVVSRYSTTRTAPSR